MKSDAEFMLDVIRTVPTFQAIGERMNYNTLLIPTSRDHLFSNLDNFLGLTVYIWSALEDDEFVIGKIGNWLRDR